MVPVLDNERVFKGDLLNPVGSAGRKVVLVPFRREC
jgi:hypothetical protein